MGFFDDLVEGVKDVASLTPLGLVVSDRGRNILADAFGRPAVGPAIAGGLTAEEREREHAEQLRLRGQVLTQLRRQPGLAQGLAETVGRGVGVQQARLGAIERAGQQQRLGLQQELGRAAAQAFGGVGRAPTGGARSAALRQQALQSAQARGAFESGTEQALAAQQANIQQAREAASQAQLGAGATALEAAGLERQLGTELGQRALRFNQISQQVQELLRTNTDPQRIAELLEQQAAAEPDPAVQQNLLQQAGRFRQESRSLGNIFERDILEPVVALGAPIAAGLKQSQTGGR